MSATVTAPVWQAAVQRLIAGLLADGDLRTTAWRAALQAIPRHEFIPRYYLQDTSTRPSRWVLHEPHDDQSISRWLTLVYSPTTIITEIADYADRGVQVPVCSSTKPDLMARMLEALDVAEGMRVLEIGTGTGYNAALLTHRLGDQGVYSIDIDPDLVRAACDRLARLGYHPTLEAGDGAAGLPEHAPFDRIIATCALSSIPAAWIDQLRPGGLILVHVEGPLGVGNLATLRRGEQPVVQGRFLPWWGCFMRRRTAAGPTTGAPRPAPTTQRPTTRLTTVNPATLDGAFAFVAQLHLPAGVVRSIRLAEDGQTPVTYLAAPDGSWCEITRQPEAQEQHTVREAGPSQLWAAIEAAWREWTYLGAPACPEFGLTITPTHHQIWYHDPDNGPHWTLPIPQP